MSEENHVFNIVDSTLEGNALLDQPKAFFLLKLCQFCSTFAPERAEKYWQMLQPLLRSIPQENQAELAELRTGFEESVPSEKKGFAAEMLAEIEEIKKLEDVNQKKAKLQDCEARLKKRFNPLGKGPVWKALVDAWLPLDRKVAYPLMKNLSAKLQGDILKRLNQATKLEPAEWTFLLPILGEAKMETLILEILADEGQAIQLDDALIERIAKKIRSNLAQLSVPANSGKLSEQLRLHTRLLAFHIQKEREGLFARLIAEMVETLAKAAWLDQVWLDRFNLMHVVLNSGAELENKGLVIFTPTFSENLVKNTPPYLQPFILSSLAGLSAKPESTTTKYNELMQRTGNNETSEAWFFVLLVKRGFCNEALLEAAKLPHAAALLPRLRRAWICTFPDTACKVIKPEDMQGDVIGELLAMGTPEKRAEFLAVRTNQGKQGVPGAMWAGVGTDTESEGVRGFWQSLTAHRKTYDEIILEYLNLNPLYSSFQRNTRKEEQFEVHLAVNGFGRYRYEVVDNALLGALVTWAEKEQTPVHSVLQAMWNAIRPNDDILRLDWLRNAILSRCLTVFGADQDVLFNDYLNWLQVELVQKGRSWTMGNQTMTLRYPTTAPLQFSLVSASAVSTYSTPRRDAIVIGGLQKYEANAQLIENAAMLYNGGKPILELTPPTPIKQNFLPNWQMGIVKNALPSIVQALLLEKVQPLQ
ncbi:MAG: hypothetical protein GYA45_06600 [Pelolinea sp.]|jgi:hypothetical protein|nr:hypothetical protein [Pelolinea sp.]